MAALLKKRALAEYSQTIQEEPRQRPLKKLHLTKKAETTKAQHVSCHEQDGDRKPPCAHGTCRIHTMITRDHVEVSCDQLKEKMTARTEP